MKNRCYPGLKGGWLWLVSWRASSPAAARGVDPRTAGGVRDGTTSRHSAPVIKRLGDAKRSADSRFYRKLAAIHDSRDYMNPTTPGRSTERILRDRQETFRRFTGRDWNYRELYLMWDAPGAFAQANFNHKKLSRVVRERAERFAQPGFARPRQCCPVAKPF